MKGFWYGELLFSLHTNNHSEGLYKLKAVELLLLKSLKSGVSVT